MAVSDTLGLSSLFREVQNNSLARRELKMPCDRADWSNGDVKKRRKALNPQMMRESSGKK